MDNHDLSVKVRVSAETDEARQALAQAEGGVKALGEAATPAELPTRLELSANGLVTM